jgi:hypothetical protein
MADKMLDYLPVGIWFTSEQLPVFIGQNPPRDALRAIRQLIREGRAEQRTYMGGVRKTFYRIKKNDTVLKKTTRKCLKCMTPFEPKHRHNFCCARIGCVKNESFPIG